jgi:predicted transcriptional regulator
MKLTAEHTVHIPGEYAEQLADLAAARRTTEAALIEEALALLFCSTAAEREELRGLFAETGPSAAKTVPPLRAEDISQAIPIPIGPSLLYRTDDEC